MDKHLDDLLAELEQDTLPTVSATSAIDQEVVGRQSSRLTLAHSLREDSAQVKVADARDGLDDLLTEVLDVKADDFRSKSANLVGVVPDILPCHGLVDNFHCVGCDNSVLRIEDSCWIADVEYMFFRSAYPEIRMLCKSLKRTLGSVAYCCQCSWRSAPREVALNEVAYGTGGNLDKDLRWRMLGR